MLMKSIELFENSRHVIAGIGTCTAAAEYLVNENDFKEKANKLGVPFFCDSKINSREVQEILISMQADIAISVRVSFQPPAHRTKEVYCNQKGYYNW